ncbi:MAG: LOW QUALITY PROTEIN: elongation factor 1 alpha-like protein, partial [Olpidium bornovanus]
MDTDPAGPYKKERFDEISAEMRDMLVKTGWKKEFVEKSVPVIPLSGWQGDNLIKKSEKMAWWSGQEVLKPSDNKPIKVVTLLDVLNEFAELPPRKSDAAMRVPISGIYKIKGVGDVLTGRVEQGEVVPNKDVIFLPTHTRICYRPRDAGPLHLGHLTLSSFSSHRSTATPCAGKIFTVEMHHKKIEKGVTGDNIGMNIKGLDKQNMPRAGDVMIYKDDSTLKAVKSFTAQIQTLDIPGEVKAGYSPIGFVRCGRSACRIKEIKWKIGKETGRKKLESPHSLKANEAAEVVFEPQQPLVVDSFQNCEGLSRIAFLDGNSA